MKEIQPQRLLGQDWLDQIFTTKSAQTGGLVRRKIVDVNREISQEALELEVRRRGYHMLRCGGHFVILCKSDPITLIC